MRYVGIDWAYARAAWCARKAAARSPRRALCPLRGRGWSGPAAAEAGPDVHACLEMMGGAVWVQLEESLG
jgi:hypothetical protein